MRDDNEHYNNGSSSSGELLHELGSIKELLDEELERPRSAPAASVEEIGSVEEYLRLKQAANEAGMSMEAYLALQGEESETSDELELLEDEDDLLPVVGEVVTHFDEDDEEAPAATGQGGDSLLVELAAEEERSPSTAGATTVEEYFAAVAAAKQRTQVKPSAPVAAPEPPPAVVADDELPALDEVTTAEPELPPVGEVVTDEEAIPVLAEVATAHSGGEPADGGMSMDDMQELVDLIVNRKLQHLKPELEREVMSELQRLLPVTALKKS